jgi:RNA polymerase sigma factor (TIGR02999 family)
VAAETCRDLLDRGMFTAAMSEFPVTQLLDAVREGSPGAADRLMQAVYSELRGLARIRLRAERPTHAPEPTSLVHQAYFRLVGPGNTHWKNRAHFFGAAGEAMRRVLVDRARERLAQKRGSGMERVTLNDAVLAGEYDVEEVLSIDQALSKLQQKDPTMANVVKLRYFAGLTIKEVSDALDLSNRTVERTWAASRAWLQRELRGPRE